MVWLVVGLNLACGTHIEPRGPEELRAQSKPERVEPSRRERKALLDVCRQLLPVVLLEESQFMYGRDGFLEPGQVLIQVQDKDQWRLYTPSVWEDCLPEWIFALDSGAWKLVGRNKVLVSQGDLDCAFWME